METLDLTTDIQPVTEFRANNKIETILWHLVDRGILFRILLCFMLNVSCSI